MDMTNDGLVIGVNPFEKSFKFWNDLRDELIGKDDDYQFGKNEL